MQKQALADLISFLEEKSSRVLEIEKEADIALKQEGQLAFQAKLEEKAEILAALGEKAWKKTDAVGGTLGDEIARKLEQFSMSASTSLRIGSVFLCPHCSTPRTTSRASQTICNHSLSI